MTVLSCHPENGTVRCRCANTAMLGERKNVNLPGVVVDLPTITEKDSDDILGWGVPNGIDFIAASFVRKGSDVSTYGRSSARRASPSRSSPRLRTRRASSTLTTSWRRATA
jgi:pyruvate kinase